MEPVFLARPVAGTCGEWARVVHYFPIPAEVPDELRAYCGARFGPGELELIDAVRGMPCERCLARVPKPTEMLPA